MNSADDILRLSFEQFDGTLVKHSVDFKSGIQTFRVTILPYRDFGQTVIKVRFTIIVID